MQPTATVFDGLTRHLWARWRAIETGALARPLGDDVAAWRAERYCVIAVLRVLRANITIALLSLSSPEGVANALRPPTKLTATDEPQPRWRTDLPGTEADGEAAALDAVLGLEGVFETDLATIGTSPFLARLGRVLIRLAQYVQPFLPALPLSPPCPALLFRLTSAHAHTRQPSLSEDAPAELVLWQEVVRDEAMRTLSLSRDYVFPERAAQRAFLLSLVGATAEERRAPKDRTTQLMLAHWCEHDLAAPEDESNLSGPNVDYQAQIELRWSSAELLAADLPAILDDFLDLERARLDSVVAQASAAAARQAPPESAAHSVVQHAQAVATSIQGHCLREWVHWLAFAALDGTVAGGAAPTSRRAGRAPRARSSTSNASSASASSKAIAAGGPGKGAATAPSASSAFLAVAYKVRRRACMRVRG